MVSKKDPAFLFYPQDFLTGTMFMSHEDTGKYIRLLCAQHQHGGSIPSPIFESIADSSPMLSSKFEKGDIGYYNIRLMKEMEKRNKKSQNISDATKAMWERRKNAIPMQSQCDPNAIPSKSDGICMPSEDEDEDVNEDKNNKKKTIVYALESVQYNIALNMDRFQKDAHGDGWRSRTPVQLQGWADAIDKMHRIDKVPYSMIWGWYCACFADGFWKDNVISPDTLRKHLANNKLIRLKEDAEEYAHHPYDEVSYES